MHDEIFRQYDIRGKVSSQLPIDGVYDLGCAIACYFKKRNPFVQTVALGMDGRTHSPLIKEELVRALNDSGLNVLFIGLCPTPVLYFANYCLPIDAGLMITASHNGKEYNGIKISLAGQAVWGMQIQEIKQLLREKKCLSPSVKGFYQEYPLISTYVEYLASLFPTLYSMNLSALIDCGNGAAGTVLPLLIEKMNWKHVRLLCADVDGTYPNHDADPTVEKNMQMLKEGMHQREFDVGIGFDGDCDRMAPMTPQGTLVFGDKLLAIFAKDILQRYPGASIVFDIKCSSGLSEVIEQLGGHAHMSASGHSIIKNQMKLHHAILAGELSCHFFFHDRYFGYDDGIYAMLRLFELLLRTNKPLDELLAIFPCRYATPEIRVACKFEDMAAIVMNVKEFFSKKPEARLVTVDGVRVMMPDGWGLVRGSNTQPVICLRLESNSPQGLQKLQDDFIQALDPYFSKAELIKELNN